MEDSTERIARDMDAYYAKQEDVMKHYSAERDARLRKDFDEWASKWPCNFKVDNTVHPTHPAQVYVIFVDDGETVKIPMTDFQGILNSRNRGYDAFKSAVQRVANDIQHQQRMRENKRLSEEKHRQSMLDKLVSFENTLPEGAQVSASVGHYYNNEFAACTLTAGKETITLRYSQMVKLLETIPNGLTLEQLKGMVKVWTLSQETYKKLERERVEADRRARDEPSWNW
jgi:hypothetical protein